MAAPARQRILDATARLLKEKGIARLTTREIAQAADAAEGSITKNFGGKLGLLTALLSSDLPETVAWRDALTPPTSRPEDLRAALTRAADAAIDFYAASLPLIAGAVADAALFEAYRAANTANGTGPQIAVQQMTGYLAAWQQQGALDPAADAAALAVMFCGAAQLHAWTDHLAGPDALPGSRADRIDQVLTSLLR
ncbi:TetR/AcrR family transcriptional regulator [Modestobacter sp. L9-4]|uniref:TetR/AcrR family transcriptional regulator n=1 Tax=Modestobacter sp. L9-4 TaxID=2851567 RepID=UPI001C749250|nr:TetR/AcrR family transcriptional regulator [Modestobacter sp. L9-4]QXG74533.1 TetR/AcrR family transcriptional regulator [Modestobacter sp. L9-4]